MSYLRVRRTTRCSQKISRRILYGETLDFKLAVTDRSNPCQGVLEPTEYLGLTAGMEWSFSIRRLIPKACSSSSSSALNIGRESFSPVPLAGSYQFSPAIHLKSQRVRLGDCWVKRE